MGTILSGRRGLRSTRPTNEQLPAWRLSNKALYGIHRGHQDIKAWLEGPDMLVLQAGALVQPVGLVHQPRRFGGSMLWASCPICDRRCRILYLKDGRFGCRHCYQVMSASQRENRRSRLFRRAAAIRRRLAWPQGVLDAWMGKPAGMRWSTFRTLTGELEEVTAKATGEVMDWLGKAEKVYGLATPHEAASRKAGAP